MNEKPRLRIYTDGGKSYKFRVASFGVWSPEIDYKMTKVVHEVSNNFAELAALIVALRLGLQYRDTHAVEIITDSEYAQLGYTQYMATWHIPSKKNSALWQIIYDLRFQEGADFTVRHCRGHGKGINDSPEDVEGNDVVDKLCTRAIEQYKRLVKTPPAG